MIREEYHSPRKKNRLKTKIYNIFIFEIIMLKKYKIYIIKI